MTRIVLALTFVAALGLAAIPRPAAAAPGKKPRILFFTKSSGFEHSVIRKRGPEPSHAERILGELAEAHGWLVDHTKDGSWITPSSLARYDAVVLQTTGDLTKSGTDLQPSIPAEGKAWLIDAVERGKGLVGVHCASDTFLSPGPRRANNDADTDPFIRLLGGEFMSHGEQQDGRVLTVDAGFPGIEKIRDGFTVKEEWYSLKNLAKDMHVLLALEPAGMSGLDYQRPRYPIAWTRSQGKGRVFYTALGHREDVWASALFRDHLAGGIRWVLGRAKADATPNLTTAAPDAHTLPPRPPPKPVSGT